MLVLRTAGVALGRFGRAVRGGAAVLAVVGPAMGADPSGALADRGEWREWRGPGQQGHAVGVSGLPLTWSETENLRWKSEVPGHGHSSPVVGAGVVWFTTALETPATPAEAEERRRTYTGGPAARFLAEVSLRVVGFEVETGALRWNIEVHRERDPPAIHAQNSYASPTPVWAEGFVYAHFGALGTACIEAATGRLAWFSRTLHYQQDNGPVSSPVVWGEVVIVQADGSDFQYVAALDRRTGRLRWRTNRSGALRDDPMMRKSYGTPLVLGDGERAELLCPAADWLYAYRPESGQELWKLPYPASGFAVVPRPVAGHGLVYLSTGFLRAELLAVAVDGSRPPAMAWRWKRSVPQTSSPILVGEELYFVSDAGGILTCLDARTGALVYQERLGGNHAASPSFADGRLYFHDLDGVTAVVRPGRHFEVLARNRLAGPHTASAAFVGNSMLLRTDRALYRIEAAVRGGPGARAR